MRVYFWVLGLVAVSMGLGGCASAEKIRSLKTGMTTAEVSEEAGNPETIRRQGDQVVWYYRTDDGRCAVVFETEKLSSLACSGDGTESGATTVAVKSASTPPPVFMH